MKKIALLGATGFIGKSLSYELSLKSPEKGKLDVTLFSRSKEKVQDFLRTLPPQSNTVNFHVCTYDEFSSNDYDVIINCTGIGNLSLVKKTPSEIFKVTEEFDNLIIGYLLKNPSSLYINLSSGAVYGQHDDYLTADSKSILPINNLSSADFYAISKINAEAKHRALPELNIVDLRLFAFFSRFIDLQASFLMSDIANCIKSKKTLETFSDDIMRDYIGPADLLSLIECVIDRQKINDVFDVCSQKPVSKFELLKYCEENFGLKYLVKTKSVAEGSSVSNKKAYFSKNNKAESLGFRAKHTSISGIAEEMSFTLK